MGHNAASDASRRRVYSIRRHAIVGRRRPGGARDAGGGRRRRGRAVDDESDDDDDDGRRRRTTRIILGLHGYTGHPRQEIAKWRSAARALNAMIVAPMGSAGGEGEW
jgi:hypothetical protein